MARNFIASSVSDLEDAGRSANASVMGPAIRDMTTDLLNDWTANPKYFEEISKASDGAQMAKSVSTRAMKIYSKYHEAKLQQQQTTNKEMTPNNNNKI